MNSLRSKRSCAFLSKGKPRNLSRSASARVLAPRKVGRAQKMKRGGGGRERLHPTIVNLKYSVRQPTESLIGSKLDRWLKPDSCLVIDYFKMARAPSWNSQDGEIEIGKRRALAHLDRFLGFPFAKYAQERLLCRLFNERKSHSKEYETRHKVRNDNLQR